MNLIATIPEGVDAITVHGLHQWDFGRKLDIHCTGLPPIIEVHFACAGMREAQIRVCNVIDDVASVAIPDVCLEQDGPVTAWIVQITGTTGAPVASVTTHEITLPVKARPRPTADAEIPVDTANKYEELIAVVNDLVPKIEGGETTVLHAENADHATNADRATSADFATNAGNASAADYATSAGSATSADNAKNATNADFAKEAKLLRISTAASFLVDDTFKNLFHWNGAMEPNNSSVYVIRVKYRHGSTGTTDYSALGIWTPLVDRSEFMIGRFVCSYQHFFPGTISSSHSFSLSETSGISPVVIEAKAYCIIGWI